MQIAKIVLYCRKPFFLSGNDLVGQSQMWDMIFIYRHFFFLVWIHIMVPRNWLKLFFASLNWSSRLKVIMTNERSIASSKQVWKRRTHGSNITLSSLNLFRYSPKKILLSSKVPILEVPRYNALNRTFPSQ